MWDARLRKGRGLHERSQGTKKKKILITKKCSCSAVVAAEQLEFVMRDKPLNMNVVGKHTHTHTNANTTK